MWVQSPDPRPAVWHVPEVSSMFKLSAVLHTFLYSVKETRLRSRGTWGSRHCCLECLLALLQDQRADIK